MGRRLRFKMGSYYAVSDRTGFPQRAERMRMQWDGLFVEESVWEPRQPQDFVKGVKDDQSVPIPRPLAANTFVGPIYAQVVAPASIGSNVISLNSVAGMSIGDAVGVLLADGSFFRSTILGIVGTNVTLTAPIPQSAPANTNDGAAGFVDYRVKGPPAPAPNPFTLDQSQLGGPDVLG